MQLQRLGESIVCPQLGGRDTKVFRPFFVRAPRVAANPEQELWGAFCGGAVRGASIGRARRRVLGHVLAAIGRQGCWVGGGAGRRPLMGSGQPGMARSLTRLLDLMRFERPGFVSELETKRVQKCQTVLRVR
jgi:hypothetical protein